MGPQTIGRTDRRVLHVMRMKGASGAERHLLELAGVLREREWESDVLIPTPEPAELKEFAEELAQVCGRVTLVRMGGHLSPRLIGRLAALLRSERYALVHAHLVHADWHVAAAGLAAPGTPLVSSKHNHDPFRRMVPVRLVEQATARRYAAVIAISDSLADYTRRWSRTPTVTVRYGLSAPDRPTVERREAGSARLLSVGRLVPQKGLDVLLRAMVGVRAERPEAQLAIAGEGEERPLLERLIEELRLEDAVTLLGQQNDIPALMREASVLAHPARWEGFGLVLLEAMREALPVVAARVGAIPEVVADGETGLLVPADDAERLTEAILRMLDDEAFAARAGAAGFRRLKEHFSPERMGDETVAVYEDVLATHGP